MRACRVVTKNPVVGKRSTSGRPVCSHTLTPLIRRLPPLEKNNTLARTHTHTHTHTHSLHHLYVQYPVNHWGFSSACILKQKD